MILLSILAWLIALYGLASIIASFIKIPVTDDYGITKKDEFKKISLPFGIPALITGLFFIILLSLLIKINGQNVGVVTTPKGVKNEPLHTGWHIVAPWNDVHKMDKTVWVYTCAHATKEGTKPNADAIWAPTKDGIKMGFDVSVSWRIIADEAPWVYQNVTENDGGNSGRYVWLEENVLRAKLKSALALTVSNYTPIEAYSYKRQEIQDATLTRIRTECKQYKLQIDNVDIREVYYNAEFEKAINNKKLAEQEALRLVDVTKQKEELLKQAGIEKDIAIQQAEGEAKSLQIKGASIASNPKIIQLEWINKWNGVLPTYVMGDGQNIMLNLAK